jgi:small nuclear ribonucleoprotein (snRNP)-like protein
MEEELQQQVVKLILLQQRNEYLIGTVTELDEEPSLLIENCYEVLGDEEIVPFPKYSSQRDIFLTSESVMSILDPSKKLLDIYSKL